MTLTTLRYQVEITDTFETPEGYSHEGAREVLETALNELLKTCQGIQVNVKRIREETVEYK